MFANRSRFTRSRILRALGLGAVAVALVAPAASSGPEDRSAVDRWDRAPSPTAVIGFAAPAALGRALERYPGRVVRSIPALGIAEVRPRARPRYFASAVEGLEGIEFVEPPVRRAHAEEPALAATPSGTVFEWQYGATRADEVPESVLRAAASITVAVVDTGADLTAPDIAAKRPLTHSVVGRGSGVRDPVGHGTFVTALAGGSVTNGEGVAGFSGDAKLMIVQASRSEGAFSDIDEAAAIVWAVDHGARVINLSLGGPDTSSAERAAVDYAAKRGALLVAAVGNEYDQGNPVEYPAALLQPVGSNGRGGLGLAVGASDHGGARASFSNTGSHLSLVAPGVSVFSALASDAENAGLVRVQLPGSLAGAYGFGSGTSFAVPQVAGAAALVWAANPLLRAQEVADILEQTATNGGAWNQETGHGVLDVAAAVDRAIRGVDSAPVPVAVEGRQLDARRIRLDWESSRAAAYRVSVREASGATTVLARATRRTTLVFRGIPGRTYSFTVESLDVAGSVAATSPPLELELPAARPSLVLRRSAAAGAAPFDVELTASLRAPGAGLRLDGREVVLESSEAGRWLAAGAAMTGDAGRATWRFRLDEPGVYRLRARFAGDGELEEAQSRAISIRVRG